MWHHLCCFLQERPSSPGRIRRLQLQRVGHTKSRPRRLVTGSVLSPQPPSLISWSTGSLKVVFFFQVCWLDMTTALAVWELLMMEWQLQQDPGTVFWRSGIEARRFFCFVFSSFFKKKNCFTSSHTILQKLFQAKPVVAVVWYALCFPCLE